MAILGFIVVRSPDLLTADLKGDTVIMEIEFGTYLSFGKIGSPRFYRLGRRLSALLWHAGDSAEHRSFRRSGRSGDFPFA